jgi:DNA invertase Pin-like site-specific DNA recombinase
MQQSGIDKQDADCHKFIEEVLKGESFPHLFIDEATSGISTKRPALNRLIKTIKTFPHWIDGIVFSDWSRPTRAGEGVASPLLNKFRRLGVEVQWLTKEADMASEEAREIALDLELGATIAQASKAKTERDNMAKAMRELKERKSAQGEWTGGYAGYGLRIENGVPVRNSGTREDRVVYLIKGLHKEGASRRSIAKTLNEKKIPAPYRSRDKTTNERNVRTWHKGTIGRILDRD